MVPISASKNLAASSAFENYHRARLYWQNGRENQTLFAFLLKTEKLTPSGVQLAPGRFDSPDEFLAYTQDHAVKVAVLDVWMPATSGIEVHELSPETQVIMITAREEAAVRAVALEGGAFAFLVKPFDDEAFLALARNVLREVE